MNRKIKEYCDCIGEEILDSRMIIWHNLAGILTSIIPENVFMPMDANN